MKTCPFLYTSVQQRLYKWIGMCALLTMILVVVILCYYEGQIIREKGGRKMSSFKEDRATLNDQAKKLDDELTRCGMDAVLHQAFEDGMNLDEMMYVIFSHTERTVRRYIVQNQLKKAANKEKV